MIRILTDSAADFEPKELEELNVDCIPLTVSFGDEEYKDNVDLPKGRFYELLSSRKEFPKTSQPSPAQFEEAILSAKAAGDEIVIITISSGLSGTVGSARIAKKMTGYERCYIVDSLCATGGERLMVEYAARLRDEGMGGREIAEAVSRARHKITLYACIDTLEYLYKGGRISRSVYAIGSVAQIKPILHVDAEGRAEIPSKALGMRRGMQYLGKRLEEFKPDLSFPFYIMYTSSLEMAYQLIGFLEKNHLLPPNFKAPIQVGSTVGSHIGSDACGMVYISQG
ncbi:MAG: DegV family protein [Firmicutes bacterium]|nr:DegV family protein [Bacillota bacterium]